MKAIIYLLERICGLVLKLIVPPCRWQELSDAKRTRRLIDRSGIPMRFLSKQLIEAGKLARVIQLYLCVFLGADILPRRESRLSIYSLAKSNREGYYKDFAADAY
jgi:hypothetical protein